MAQQGIPVTSEDVLFYLLGSVTEPESLALIEQAIIEHPEVQVWVNEFSPDLGPELIKALQEGKRRLQPESTH